VDETYVRVGGKWKYLFRAVDKHGQLIDFMLSPSETPEPFTAFCAKL
jgi:IS6 family transposase